MVSILSKIALVLLALSCVQGEHKKTYIDGDDLIPPEPSWIYYFTMHGKDSDEDGVRDDVELWINEKMDRRNMRLAAKSLAQVYDEMLYSADDSARFLKLIKEEQIRSACFSFVTIHLLNASRSHLKEQLWSQVYDNYWKKSLYRKGFSHRPSGSYRVANVHFYEKGIGCKFKIEGLWEILDQFLKRYPVNRFTKEDKEKIKDMYEVNPDKYNPYDILGERRSGP